MAYRGLTFEVSYADGHKENINAKWNIENIAQKDSIGNRYHVYLQTLDGKNLSYDENYEPGKYQYVVQYDDNDTVVSAPCYIEIVHPDKAPEVKLDISGPSVTEIKAENKQVVAKFTSQYDMKCTLTTDQNLA